jgi:outer membrane protein assembly factor BamB
MFARSLTSLTLLIILTLGGLAEGADWPQILGPQRDGQAADERPLADSWPATGLSRAWTHAAESGYAGPAVVGSRVLCFDRAGDQERLTAVSLERGQPLWQASWPASYRSAMDPDSGPRCVPTAAAGRVVCYGAAGDLACVDLESGKLLWLRPLRKETRAEDGYFGAGSSPLITEGTVIVNVGGREAGIVGVDLETGQTRWSATSYDASYSSPVATRVMVDGQARAAALVVTRLRTVLLDVETGQVYGEVDFGARGPTVNAATPLPVGSDRFLLTASYGVGAMVVSQAGGGLKMEWRNRELLSSQYNTPVLVNGKVWGCDGREDLGTASLKAISLEKQAELWEHPLSGTAHLIAVGPRILLLTVDGTVKLIDAGADTYRELGSSPLPPGIYRSLPAFSQGKLLVRRTLRPGQSEFLALELP